jgi:hypothetical protein
LFFNLKVTVFLNAKKVAKNTPLCPLIEVSAISWIFEEDETILIEGKMGQDILLPIVELD